MPTWVYWALFFVVGAGAIFAAKWLDDREQRLWAKDAKPKPKA